MADDNATQDTAVTRDQILAEMADVAKQEPAPQEPAPAPEEPADPDPAEQSDDDGDAESDAESDDSTDSGHADPETRKRLDAVRKAESRARESLARDRAALAAERSQHERDIAEMREFSNIRSRAKYDLVSVIKSLGITEDAFEDAARALYAHSPKGAADPKNKEAVERTLRERQLQDRLDEVARRLDEREKEEHARAQQAAASQQAQRYLDGVAKSATAKVAPLAAHFLAKSPEKTRLALGQIAIELAGDSDEPPRPADVLRAYEKIRRHDLIDMGVDPDALVGKAKSPAPAVRPSDSKVTNTSDKIPTKEDILREMNSL